MVKTHRTCYSSTSEEDIASSSSVRHRPRRRRKTSIRKRKAPVRRRQVRRRLTTEESTSIGSSSSQDERIFLRISKKRKAEDEDSDELFVKPTSADIPRKPLRRATKRRRTSDETNTSNRPGSSVQDFEEEGPKPRTKRTRNPHPPRRPQGPKRRPVHQETSQDPAADHPVLALKGPSIFAFRDKYLKLEKIGQGGFGSVFAGVRKSDNLPVAIKFIKKPNLLFTTVMGVSGQYIVPTEVLLVHRASGDQSCIGQNAAVSLIEWFDFKKTLIIVMERPENSINIFDLVYNNTGPLPEEQAKELIREVISATMEVLEKGVFHRDLKCSNILVQPCTESACGFRVRIVDFGCGTFLEPSYEGMYFGTMDYSPPECWDVGRYRADPTCVWQVAAILFELLDGRREFSTFDMLEGKLTLRQSLSANCYDFLISCLTLTDTQRLQLSQLLSHPWF